MVASYDVVSNICQALPALCGAAVANVNFPGRHCQSQESSDGCYSRIAGALQACTSILVRILLSGTNTIPVGARTSRRAMCVQVP